MHAAALTVSRELMCIRPAAEIGTHCYLENDISIWKTTSRNFWRDTFAARPDRAPQ
jgi:hypothetical protein